MSTALQLINKVKKRYSVPSNWSDSDIIEIFNDTINTIYRSLQIKSTYDFLTVEDTASYDMPDDMSVEFIKFLGISPDETIDDDSRFQEYKYISEIATKHVGGYVYGVDDGQLRIYPTPKHSDHTVRVLYYSKPQPMVTTSDSPGIQSDWEIALVYAAIIEIASSGDNPDIDTANNITTKYNFLMRDILQTKHERDQSYKRTKDVMKRGNYSRYYARGSGRIV